MHGHSRTILSALLLALSLIAAGCAGGDALSEGGDTAADADNDAPAEAENDARNDGPNDVVRSAETEKPTVEAGPGGPIVIGSANFPEQLVLANLYGLVLEDAGFEVDTSNLNLGSREITFPALEAGELELVPEYSGAVLAYLTKGESTLKAPEEVMAALREELPEGIVALEPSTAEDKDGLTVLPATAEQYGLESIADLADVAGELSVGGPPEMETREGGLPALEEVYGVVFGEFRALDAGGPLTTEALLSGQIDVARMFTTQGVIEEEGLVLLDDPENLAPAQQIVPLIREEVLTDGVREALDELSATLTTEDLTALNKLVEVDRRDPDAVALEYLQDKGLVGQ